MRAGRSVGSLERRMVSEGMDPLARDRTREQSNEQLGGTRREKRGKETRGWRRVRAACIFLRLSS